ncbi:MAG: BlaI/MecI/CopY family transcriptional regulator [Pirellulaceae bacterium]
MSRPTPSHPTDVELQILGVLWKRRSGTVREIHDALAATRDTGYSTTLKMLQVMLEKGLVARDDSVRPQVYRPAKSQQQTQLQLLDNLTRKAFGGSAKRLVMHMLSSRRISAAELAEIQRLIRKAEGESDA